MGPAHPAMEPEPPRSRLRRAPFARVTMNKNGILPLQRPMTRFASFSTAALLGGSLFALGFGALPRPAQAASGPFAALVGSWGGTGSIQPGNGTTERIRCNAIGTAGGDQITVHVESGAFAANLSLVTRGRRQNVTIDSPGGGKPVKAAIALSRR